MLPFETIAALFPRVHCMDKGGAIALRPVTIAHIVAMEMMGIDLDFEIKPENALVVAWLLSQDACDMEKRITNSVQSVHDFSKWIHKTRFRLLIFGKDLNPDEVAKIVNGHITLAFSAIIEGVKTDNTQHLIRSGLGWVLELAEWYAHEYGRTIDEAIVEPLSRVFALVACSRQRNGLKHGAPDYFERIEIKKVKEQLKTMGRENRKEGA